MTEAARTSRLEQAAGFLRQRGAGIALEVGVNFVLPFLAYSWAKPHYGEVGGLLASSVPPILWSLVEFARTRRVDALSILVLSGIAASLLAYLGGGGVKFLQLREKLVTFAIGLVFLGSAAIRRPLIYYLALSTIGRRSSEEAASFQALNTNIYFRRTMSLMTLVWGLGLVGEAMLSGALVFVVSVKRYLIISPIIGYST